MVITTKYLNVVGPTTIEDQRSTHTGTKIIEYLTISNTDNTPITVSVDFGHPGQAGFITEVEIPVGVTLKVIDSPMEIPDTYPIRVSLGDAAYIACAHLAIKYPPINNIKT